ncbi:uncharacterized protein G2W53_038051 [Senna tora]|uniref:Uncharacterized protein n=1 Tax=Senna tora TaxID=362788 RepID=A0A834SNH5_9FABA|nr:uncharacterized protein G2W53_038051 [Senna tora]
MFQYENDRKREKWRRDERMQLYTYLQEAEEGGERIGEDAVNAGAIPFQIFGFQPNLIDFRILNLRSAVLSSPLRLAPQEKQDLG